MKKSKISICGLDCARCGAYIAWQNNDEAVRIKTAKDWNQRYKDNRLARMPLKPSDINCRGCLSLIDPVFRHCKDCEVRLCGLGKNVTNCGRCKEYDNCGKIKSLHEMIPEAKKVSDEIRKVTR